MSAAERFLAAAVWLALTGAVLVVGVGGVALTACSAPSRPELTGNEIVFINGKVWTMAADPARARAEAMAVRGERIVAVGTAEQVRAAVGPAARVLDLHGAAVLPGFVDAHIHLLWIGEKLLRSPDRTPLVVDLSASRSASQAAALAAAQARALPEGSWVLGYGWDQEEWPGRVFPTAVELDAALPAQPAVLTRADFHAVWVNSEALRRAGIRPRTPEPEGGRIVRLGRTGQPTGILLDRAVEPVARLLPRLTPEEKREAYRLAARACLAAGITSAQVAGALHRAAAVWDPDEEAEDRRILRELLEREDFPLRIFWMALGPGPGAEHLLTGGPVRGALGGTWDEAAIKVFMDGALGSRGAALLGDYADERGTRGILRTHGALGSRGAALLGDYADERGNRGIRRTRGEVLADLARRGLARGVQVCAHAIGSRAVREALDAFEKASGGDIERLHQARFRIEHASAIHPDDLPRFAALGVIASVQPAFISPDAEGRTMEDRRLGPAAPEKIYPFRSLMDSGARVCGSTDAGAPGVSVLAGMEAAVTRSGWRAAERLRVPEALALFTRESARAAFMEERIGTLEVGKFADLVILASDPMAVEAEALGEIEVLATVAGGRIVYGEERLRELSTPH